VDDRINSIGEYGKPNWVGAEFQSLDFQDFSMTVMWEHADAEILMLSTHLGLSPVQGYQIRILSNREARSYELVVHCFCVTDPSIRNISGIRSTLLTYAKMSNLIVEVRAFPSLVGQDERNTRRNCSLLSGCSTIEYCRNGCYSWPQSCLSFLPSYNPPTCVPPVYGPPVNIIAEMSLVDDKANDNVFGKLSLSWEPPRMNYELFPIPNVYYIVVWNSYKSFQFKAVKTTNITVLYLNTTVTSMYHALVRAYVPCSGLTMTITDPGELFKSDVGCGSWNSIEVTVVAGDCAPPTPLRGRIKARMRVRPTQHHKKCQCEITS
jgi:hypothetical protein